jgi:glycerate 2-kinase
MKIVLAFDSFKGNLSAREVCDIAAEGIRSVRSDIETAICPMADGGEGTAEALMSALGGEWIPLTVTGPLPEMKVEAGYVWLPESKTAVVEMAAAAGLPLLRPEEYDPIHATTYGVGELIKAAAERGARKILLTVGGSATVDGGVGAAEALGWRFLDEKGEPTPAVGHPSGGGDREGEPTPAFGHPSAGGDFPEIGSRLSLHPENFPNIGKIVPPRNLNLPEIDVLCDGTNPLCGPKGAARVYGPQKGATPEQVEVLEGRLASLAAAVQQQLGKDFPDVPGAGAAGGLGFGAAAFMNGKLVPGVDAVMETVGLADALRGADWALTGEGKFDSQSVQGKVVDGVQRLAKAAGAQTGVMAGCVKLSEADWRAAGVDRVASLQPEGMSTEESIARSRELLFEAAAGFARGL